MPYRIHHADRHKKAMALADLIATVPVEELAGLLDEAKVMLLRREFGGNNRGRNSDPNDPYWYENHLIADANRYIAKGSPLDAFMYSLNEHNHGHSGFTGQSYRVYMHPVNDAEREMSENIRQMILSVADALINSDPLSRNVADFLGDGWQTISSIYSCLTMLGQDVPPEMIGQLRCLLGGCTQFAEKNSEISQLQHSFTIRFG